MLGTMALVVLFTLTALAVVLYAAYCEAGEDLPCKRVRRRSESSHPNVVGSSPRKGSS
ncbi:MAG TPA: hypothetical protein VII23_21130 [Terriglobales bacterium]